MKLGARDIAGFLRQPDRFQTRAITATLIYGGDRGQVQARAKQIQAALLPDADPFAVSELSLEQVLADPALLADEMAAMSLLGGRRVVLLRDASDKAADAIAASIEQAVNYLLVTAEECGPRSALRRLFESDERLAALPCYAEEAASIGSLIAQTLTAEGFTPDREIVTAIAAQYRGERGILLQELEKIILFHRDGSKLTLASVQRLLQSEDAATLDELCQAAGDGQPEALMRRFDRLLAENTPEIVILRALARHFARLEEIHTLTAQGKSVDDAVKALRPPVFFKEQPKLARQARRWPGPRLKRVQQMLLETERACKTSHELAAAHCAQALLRISAMAG